MTGRTEFPVFLPRKNQITKVADTSAATRRRQRKPGKEIAPDIAECARQALGASGRDPDLPLSILRMREGEVATLSGVDVVVKVYLGPEGAERAAQSQAAQARAAGLRSPSGHPLAPPPGPAVSAAFAMNHVEGGRATAILEGLWPGPKRRLMATVGGALSVLHARVAGEMGKTTGWPAKNLMASLKTAPPPWPGFIDTAEHAAERVWWGRGVQSPLGSRHGDLHIDNLIHGRGGVLFIDFRDRSRSPVHIEIARFLASAFVRTRFVGRMAADRTGMPEEMTRAFISSYGDDIAIDDRLAALVSVFLHTGALRLASRGKNRARLARTRALVNAIDERF